MSHPLVALRRCLGLGGLLAGLAPAAAGAHALSFQAPAASVPEGAGSIALAVTRTGSGTTPYVFYRVARADPGTASAGTDYTPISGTLTFGPAQHVATVVLPVLDDALAEEGETVRLELHDAGPAGDGHLGAYPTTTVTILDDDSDIGFAASVQRVDEAAGRATVAVTRTGTLAGTDTVDYATADGTARAGDDYEATAGTLTFADGETTRSFDVPIVDDARDEDDETVSLLLGRPAPDGTHLRPPGMASLVVADDDATPDPPVTTEAPPVVAPERSPRVAVAFGPAVTAARLAATGRLPLRVRCAADCAARAGARLGVRARAWRARSAARALRGGRVTRLFVPLTPRARGAIRRALAHRRTVRLRLVVTARAPGGGVRRVGRLLRLRR